MFSSRFGHCVVLMRITGLSHVYTIWYSPYQWLAWMNASPFTMLLFLKPRFGRYSSKTLNSYSLWFVLIIVYLTALMRWFRS